MISGIPSQSMYSAILRSINRAQGRISELQRGLADGRAIHAPSDDPVGTALTLRARDRIAAINQYQRNLSNGRSHLEATDSLLTQIEEVVIQSRVLVTQAGNGSLGPDDRAILGEQADALVREALDLGNQRFAGVHLLGGVRSLEKPFVARTDRAGAIVGISSQVENDTPIVRQVGEDVFLSIRVPASDVFGEGQELFARLIELRDALRDDDRESLAELGRNLDADHDRVVAAHGVVGTLMLRAEGLESNLQSDAVTVASDKSRLEDLDVPAALMELQQQEVALQAALQTGARILSLSLLDYLD